MYFFTKRVGSNYSILDYEDGAVDWVSKEEVHGYVVDNGVEICGVSSDAKTFTPQRVILPASKCNWADGENIFGKARGFYLESGNKFRLTAGKRKFKGKVRKVSSEMAMMEFNSGVCVVMTAQDYDMLTICGLERGLQVIQSLVGPDRDFKSLPKEYHDAVEAGDFDKVALLMNGYLMSGVWPAKK